MKKIIPNIPPIISNTLTKVQYMLAIFRNIQVDLGLAQNKIMNMILNRFNFMRCAL